MSLQQLSEEVLADLAFDDDNVDDGNAGEADGVVGGDAGEESTGGSISGGQAGAESALGQDSEDESGGDDNDELDETTKRDNDIARLVASGSDFKTVARVYYSKTFRDIIAKVRHYIKEANETAADAASASRAASQDEYDTILAANNIVPDIDNDIAIVHKYVVDHWGPRLPELFSLVRNAIDYVRTVKALGNTLIPSSNLRDILPAPVEMVVTMSLSSAIAGAEQQRDSNDSGSGAARSIMTAPSGRELTSRELECAMNGCDVALELEAARVQILAFIEARMSVVSPNLSALVGTSVAARLLGAAGNLRALCRIPACNVLVLGQNKKYSAGLSNIGAMRHRGYVWDADIVRRTTAEFRRQAARMVSSKVCLCARVDATSGKQSYYGNSDTAGGSFGRSVREGILKRLEKVMAAPPSKSTKALPIPDDAPKKRRGGRRARKQKEQYAVTEMSKAANRVEFNVPEVEVLAFDQIRGLGMLGAKGGSGIGSSSASTLAGAGKVRVVNAKSKVRTSEKLKQKLRAIGGLTPGTATSLFNSSGTSVSSGTATSLSFTPVQGLEFADPQRANNRAAAQAANERWFGRKVIMQTKQPEMKNS